MSQALTLTLTLLLLAFPLAAADPWGEDSQLSLWLRQMPDWKEVQDNGLQFFGNVIQPNLLQIVESEGFKSLIYAAVLTAIASNLPQLLLPLGFTQTGIVSGSLAARMMSASAISSGGGVLSMLSGGMVAASQSIAARGAVHWVALKALSPTLIPFLLPGIAPILGLAGDQLMDLLQRKAPMLWEPEQLLEGLGGAFDGAAGGMDPPEERKTWNSGELLEGPEELLRRLTTSLPEQPLEGLGRVAREWGESASRLSGSLSGLVVGQLQRAREQVEELVAGE